MKLAWSTLVTILAATTASAAPPARSETDGQVQIRVSYADLDLANDLGKAALRRRVDQAVRIVCDDTGHRDLSQQMAAKQCVHVAQANVATQMAVLASNRRLASGDRAIEIAVR